jgi:hypothetical protein
MVTKTKMKNSKRKVGWIRHENQASLWQRLLLLLLTVAFLPKNGANDAG